MSGIMNMVEKSMAEEAARRPLTAEEAAELQDKHRAIRARAERILGTLALGRCEPSSHHPGVGGRVTHYDHHWRVPMQVGAEGAMSVRGERATVYAQIGACTLKDDPRVEYYEIRAYGVPQDMKPETGPRWPFAPQFPEPALLEAELPATLIQADADQVNYFDKCLADLERIAAA